MMGARENGAGMRIEVLFPEICDLYGEMFNVKYLARCLPGAEVVGTRLGDTPLFARERPALIYMGTMTEANQQKAIEALRPHRQALTAAVEADYPFLVTGNGLEVFSRELYEEETHVGDGLGLLPLTIKRRARKRFNSLYLGTFAADGAGEAGGAIPIVGFKSVFGFAYPAGGETFQPLFETQKGYGLAPDEKAEGVRLHNFLATYVIGPLLVLNPPFTRWVLRDLMGAPDAQLAYEEACMDAYELRLREYREPNRGFYY